jgi:hypothetical protein
MEQPAQVMPMTNDQFWKVYWISPLQMITLINPKPYDYKFMVEMRSFIIRSGAKEKMPGTVANVYLSQMTRIMAQDEDKMNFLSDFALMRQYYDKLIVDVESLIAEDRSLPAYLSNVPENMRVNSEPETPPWQAPVESAIPETNSTMSNTWGKQEEIKTVPEAPTTPVEESSKEFEYEGAKYKMSIDKNDKENFFKDGTRVSAADYAKAASMI